MTSPLRFIHESPARWDAGKARIVGGAPAGIFDTRYAKLKEDALVPGEWWRVEEDERVLGYGWLEVSWGDGEILLAVDPAERGRGVGEFILRNLNDQARARGLNYLTNVVRPTHPEAEALTRWL
ncbi:MAG: GNAT family N-acetyltransferase, partial [Deltaproteobacteria bacterium]|nr:GNAT family N-acetyltransferase [Deltaproteobacteria bacterium]